jgi:RecJ-like exonuclease
MPSLEEIRNWLEGKGGADSSEPVAKSGKPKDAINKEQCRDCQGNGVNIFGDKCETCGGKGKSVIVRRSIDCGNCYGTGYEPFTGAKCEICGGKGDIDFDTRKDVSKLAKRLSQVAKSNGRYKISEKGDDALIKFGTHRGKTLVEIRRIDPTYLEWILKENFPEDIKDICRYILNKKSKKK